MAREEATADRIDAVYIEGFKAGYSQARFDLEQEPCCDAISRQAALDCFTATKLKKFDFILYARDELKKLPPVTPAEKVGHWIGIDEEPHEDYECDKCGYTISTYTANIEPHTEYKYCPNCGCRMIDPQESEE